MEKQEFNALLKQVESVPYDISLMKNVGGNFVKLNCGITHYEIGGSGDNIAVLVHGFSTPYGIYDKVFAGLIAAGYKVIRYDLLGRGYSERVKARYDTSIFVRQLDELTKYLIGDKPFFLFGTSMGGSIVTAFAVAFPQRVRKLVLLAPAGMDNFNPPLYMKIAKLPVIGELLFAVIADKVMLKGISAELYHCSAAEKDYYARMFADSIKYKGFTKALLSSLRYTILQTKTDTKAYIGVEALKIPTLCLWGTIDKTMPYYQAKRFQEVCPNAKLVTFEGSGHVFVYDEGAKTMNEVLPFLRND